ncbi:hypothetical protein SVAN01_08568 [Stagonosporopsis vannaccii]|nr:hypothetical protein SVAN01_08568 [Stagonosporopsis vannaccii]
MASPTNPGLFPTITSTVLCDLAEAVSTTRASASSPNEAGLGISFKDRRDYLSDSAPSSVPSSSAVATVSRGADTGLKHAEKEEEKLSAGLPSGYFDLAFAPSAKKRRIENAPMISQGKEPKGPTSTISHFDKRVGEYPADLSNTATGLRPKTTDSGRVKALLKASGLRINTQGLRSRLSSLRVTQHSGDSGGSSNSRPDTGLQMGAWGREDDSSCQPE